MAWSEGHCSIKSSKANSTTALADVTSSPQKERELRTPARQWRPMATPPLHFLQQKAEEGRAPQQGMVSTAPPVTARHHGKQATSMPTGRGLHPEIPMSPVFMRQN